MKWWKSGSTTVDGVCTAGENFFKNVVLILKTQIWILRDFRRSNEYCCGKGVDGRFRKAFVSDTRFVFMVGFRLDVRSALDLYMFLLHIHTLCSIYKCCFCRVLRTHQKFNNIQTRTS